MHGHNRKLGAFFYGGKYFNYEEDGRVKNALIRIIPLMCCKENNMYSLKSSRFHMDKSKEGTARQTVFKQLNVKHSYTLEASYLGYRKKGELIQFRVSDYEECGKTLLNSFMFFLPNK